mgnify:CR=1 FL=1
MNTKMEISIANGIYKNKKVPEGLFFYLMLSLHTRILK